MSKRDHDLNQLKEFANEIAWLEAKLIQQRESKDEKKTSKSTRRRKKQKSSNLNMKTSRSESEIFVKNKWPSESSEGPETSHVDKSDGGVVKSISKAAKKVARSRRKLRKVKLRRQMPKWKARRAKSTVERLVEFRERGGTPDMNASLVLSPVVKVVKKTVTEQTMAMDLLSSPTWMRDDILSKSDASPDKKNITGACQSGKSTQLEGQRGGGDKDVVISQ